jgi:hypothetical protein
MEPVTTTELTLTLWKIAVEPVVKSIEKEYGDEVKKLLKSGIEKALVKLPFKKKEVEIIEAEILEADESILTNEKKFLEFIQNNNEMQDIMNEMEKREPNINIIIEKSYNEILIDGNNNSITF